MKKDDNRFNYFEQTFLRISLALLGSGIVIFSFMLIFSDYIYRVTSLLSGLIFILLLSSFASFIIAVFRIIKYIFVIAKKQDGSRISKSVITFFTSPLAMLIYILAVFVLAASSCEIQ